MKKYQGKRLPGWFVLAVWAGIADAAALLTIALGSAPP